MFSRSKLGAAAKELADHLQLVEHVAALKTAQKETAEAVTALADRIRHLEADMAVLKAEVKLEALREAQSVVYAVQAGLNQQIQDLAVKVAVQGAGREPPASASTVRELPAPDPI